MLPDETMSRPKRRCPHRSASAPVTARKQRMIRIVTSGTTRLAMVSVELSRMVRSVVELPREIRRRRFVGRRAVARQDDESESLVAILPAVRGQMPCHWRAGWHERAVDRESFKQILVLAGLVGADVRLNELGGKWILTAVEEHLPPAHEPDQEPAFVVAVVEPLRT